jgi:hypothetical protein
MRAHAALAKLAFRDGRQAAWITACRVSDEVACKEAHADNRELASNVNQIDFSDEDDRFPKVGSSVRLAGLRHNDRVFNGVLGTVLPHSEMSTKLRCFRVRFHCLLHGLSFLIVRATNMIPVSEEYTQPLENSSKVILVGLAFTPDAQHDGHLGFVSGQADGKFFVKLLSDSRMGRYCGPCPVLHLSPHNLKLVHEGAGSGSSNADTGSAFSLSVPSRKSVHPTKRMRDAEPYFRPIRLLGPGQRF